MSREYPSHPLPGVLAVVVRDGRLLLVKRGREPDKGKWGFPGGLVELGETVAQAATRELMEETGVRAEAGTVAEIIDVVTPDAAGRIRYHFILNVVACRWLDGDGAAGDDAEAVGWFTPGELDAMECSRNVGRLARAALAQL